MKRILIFSLDYYPGEVGGAEIAIKAITDRIPKDELEFHLITLRYDTTMAKVENLDGVLVHRIGFGKQHPTIAERRSFPLHLNKHLFQFWAALKALQLHRQYHYDGIWAMMAHSCGVPAALFKWWHPDVKFVLTLQEGDPPAEIERKVKPLWPLFKRAFTKADAVQVISNFLGQWAKRMGFPGTPILVPNAVNVSHFSQTVAEPELLKIKTELGKRSGDVYLVTTSRLVPKNGLDDVIRALPKLPSNVSFIVFGNGPQKESLAALTRELKVAERVQWRGLINQTVMPHYLQACDIFIRPSRSEGMGNSFIEAMAAGLPVIATQEGGIADFLFDAKRNPDKPTTGWAVSVDTPTDIVTAVEDIIRSPERVKAVTQTAYAMVKEQYDWDLVAQRMRTEVFKPLWK